MKFINRPQICIRSLLIIVLQIALIANLTGCTASVKSYDLMSGMSPNKVSSKATNEKFINNVSQFSIELFKKSISDKENSLISPLSVLVALSMTANGAEGETLSQMEKVLCPDIPIEDWNEYLNTYIKKLPSEEKSKLSIANSIWLRDYNESLTVNSDFLQKNADYYNADSYKSAFDNETVKDINNWTKKSTDNMIDKVIDRIDSETVMFIINAVVFDARWENEYYKEDIQTDSFTSIDGSVKNVKFMCSSELKYIDDNQASGFIKPYKNGDYSFLALLPNENINIKDYIPTLTGKLFQDIVKSAQNTSVSAFLPKFSYNYSLTLNDALKSLGIKKAFSTEAEFGKLGKSPLGNIFIGKVFHKTFIAVDELGTKAGAVTKEDMNTKSATFGERTVKLDRPFVYAIIDNKTNLPVFIGTVMSLED